MKSSKHQRSKQRCQDLCLKAHNSTLCMGYVRKMFLLVSSSVSSKQLLCFVCDQGKKRVQKHTAKNFVEFPNHSPLLNMCSVLINSLEF